MDFSFAFATKSRIRQLERVYLQGSICMCDFLARFGMHGYLCVFLVTFFSLPWIFPCVAVLFGLSLTFLVSIEVMGSHVLVELDYRMDSKLSEVDV